MKKVLRASVSPMKRKASSARAVKPRVRVRASA
jgi:hypothetical protein